MRAQQVLLEKQAKHFPCPFSLPAPGLIVGQAARDSTPGPPLFCRISVTPWTHLSVSPPPARGAQILQPPRRHETGAGASPPWPARREKHQQEPPKLGWHPCTDTPAEPRDKYPCGSEAVFHRGPGFAKGPSGTSRSQRARRNRPVTGTERAVYLRPA